MTEVETAVKSATEPVLGNPPNLYPLATAPSAAGQLGREKIVWTPERINLIKTQICPAGATDDEFAVFLEIAKRAQMDPLMKECFLVKRRLKIDSGKLDGRGQAIEVWVTKHEFQPAEQGMEARADRFDDFMGIQGAAYYSKDTIKIDEANGKVEHIYNASADRGTLIGAWAISHRRGRATHVVDVKLEERIQKDSQGNARSTWRNPKTMIEKCARMASLRISYPNVFSGMFIEGEMPADNDERDVTPERTVEQEAHGGTTRTERAAAQIEQRASQAKPLPPRTVDAPKPSDGPVVRFGTHKNRVISTLTVEELQEIKGKAETALVKTPDAAWAPELRQNFAEVQEELHRKLQATPPKQPEREPGADEDEDPIA